jgi:hypothetical protein
MFKEAVMACGNPVRTSVKVVKVGRALVDIRSVHLPNTSLERYRYIKLLGQILNPVHLTPFLYMIHSQQKRIHFT